MVVHLSAPGQDANARAGRLSPKRPALTPGSHPALTNDRDAVRPSGARCPLVRRSSLRHVLGGRPLLPLHNVELHRVTLGQRLEARPLDRAVMHETVLLAVVRRNETEPLRIVEPLHLTGRAHSKLLTCRLCLGSGTRRYPDKL